MVFCSIFHCNAFLQDKKQLDWKKIILRLKRKDNLSSTEMNDFLTPAIKFLFYFATNTGHIIMATQ